VADPARVKLNALTGLRFVAASMIVLHHSRRLAIPVLGRSLDHGVSFFFVLSGFILAYAYPKLESGRDVADFLAARIARIWPAHVVGLLLALLALRMAIDRTFVANLLLVHGWVPSLPWYFGYNAPSWSISTELFFYLVFPALIFRWRDSWRWKWLATALLVVALIALGKALDLPNLSHHDVPTLHGLLYISPLARLFEFTTGMVVYTAFRRLQPAAAKVDVALFTLLELSAIGFAGYCIVSGSTATFLRRHCPDIAGQWIGHSSDVFVFPFVILVFAFERGWLSRFFGSAPMMLLGEISYSIYLVHVTVFEFYLRRWMVSGTGPDYFGFAGCVAVTLVIAFTIWVFIEAPCRAAVKRWLRASIVGAISGTISTQLGTRRGNR
jgi:peptidoglycan/LPS O-acetylase OafA/YrhL